MIWVTPFVLVLGLLCVVLLHEWGDGVWNRSKIKVVESRGQILLLHSGSYPCQVLHDTADLEREIYGKVVSHSAHLHITRDCPLVPPPPPKGPGGGSKRPGARLAGGDFRDNILEDVVIEGVDGLAGGQVDHNVFRRVMFRPGGE